MIYKVTCLNCKKSDRVDIDKKNNIQYLSTDHIISGRYRLDMQWGWECLCGNNDIVTEQEKKEIRNLQAPDPVDITKVLKALKPDKPRFEMAGI